MSAHAPKSRLRSRSIGFALSFGAVFSLFSQSVFSAEGAEDKSLFLPLDAIIVNMAAAGRSMPLPQAIKAVAPFAKKKTPPPDDDAEDEIPAATSQPEQDPPAPGAGPGMQTAGAVAPLNQKPRARVASASLSPAPAAMLAGIAAMNESAPTPKAQAPQPSASYAEDEGEHYLRVKITLGFPDQEAKAEAKAWLPLIRSRMIELLSSQSPSTIRTPEQKEALSQALVAISRAPSARGAAPHGVSSAFITDLIVQ